MSPWDPPVCPTGTGGTWECTATPSCYVEVEDPNSNSHNSSTHDLHTNPCPKPFCRAFLPLNPVFYSISWFLLVSGTRSHGIQPGFNCLYPTVTLTPTLPPSAFHHWPLASELFRNGIRGGFGGKVDGGKEREEGSLKLTVEAVGGVSMGSGQVCNL